MPMRFANLDGSMIDVYQAVTQMTDESGQTYPFTIDTLLNRALGSEGYYGVFTANMHTDTASSSGEDAIIASAQARGVPVVSGRQMLTWLDGRNGSSFGNLTWNANRLTFTIAVGAGANGLRAMLPTTSAVGALTGITLDGIPVSYTTQTIKGVDYAFFDAAAGSYEADYAVDTTAPVISAVHAAPGDDGSASITWTTDEPSDSQVGYGTSDTNLDLAAGTGTLVTNHTVTVTGLDPNTTYYFRVSSTDAANNTATFPEEPAAPASFSTPSASVHDVTAADFGAGSGANTYVSQTGDGEVILAPTVGAEFDGSTVPSGWTATPWSGGGSATVAGGFVALDEDLLTNDTLVSPGHSLEFVADFSAANQHVGFANDFNSGDWAIFSTGATGDQLYARSLVGGQQTNLGLGLSYLNGYHRYRIDWSAAGATFFIDGTQVASQAVSFTTSLRPAASDSGNGSGSLAIDWMRMSPYATSATFTSRVLDAGTQVDWGTLNAATQVPTGASAPTFMVRVGNTPTPGAGWTSFTSVANGGDVPGSSQYLQYQVSLGTSDAAVTPEVDSVSIGYVSSSDTTPPTIVSRAPGIDEVDALVGTSVVVTFSEPVDATTVTSSSFRLQAEGGGSDVPATISTSGAQVTLDPASDLDPSTVYTVTVGGTIADPSGNQLGADNSWTFTTSAPVLSLTDTTATDFGAGQTGPSTYVSDTADGEVTMSPTVGAEFSGSSLPSGWSTKSSPWVGGGSATVGGGLLTVDGTMAGTNATFGPGGSLEFVATFSSQSFQHVGFVNSLAFDGAYAIVSTGSAGDGVYARTSSGGQVSLGSGLLGSAHRYRIDWSASGFDFYVDGVFETTLAFATAGPMLVGASDSALGTPLTVDWLHLTPYPASGTFASHVLDSGGTATWRTLDYVSTVPGGTSLSLQVRTGDTPTPDDGMWSAFVPLTNGSDIPGESRYVQYQAAFTSSDANLTPTLASVSISYTLAPDTEPPTTTGQSPAPGATDVSRSTNVSVAFSEPIDQATLTGTSFTLTQQGAGSPVAVTVSYNSATETATLDPSADLAPGAVYTARVTTAVTDVAGNHLAADSVWSFTVQAGAFTDTTTTDFAAGTLDSGTYVSQTGDGEVILAPTVGEEFSGGPGLPSGWSSIPWTGGAATVSSGALAVDGTLAATDTYYSAGRSIEFVATFGEDTFQHVGFGQSLASLSESWAMFSTLNTTNTLYARTDNNGTQVDDLIPGTWIGSPHRFRIDWTASSVVFSIDGAVVDTQAVAIGATMRPVVSDYNNGGPVVSVDWLQMTPYASSGTFTSRVFDAGESMSWIGLSWTADQPAGTGVTMSARTGDTPTPDGSWSAFRAITSSGDPVGAASRYIQYQATLSTTDPDQTPTLRDVTLTYVVPVLDHLVLSPASATIAAGASQAYTAEGFDSHANSLGDVTGSTTFSIDGAGTCAGADCGSNVAGSYTVTGTDGSASGTASLTVTAAGLDHLVLSPASATIAAGASQAYTAEGFDSHANSLGDVTGSTTFSIDGAGTCAGADCGSNVAGSYTVTGTDGSASGTASLTVTAAGLDHLVLSPASATIAAGASQAYTAEGFDSHANSLGDVTGSTTFSIDGAGTCAGADCGSNVAGSYTVTGTDGSASGTASLTVTAAGLDHLVLSPASATIAAGASQAYTAEGFDSHANSLGDVTGSTTFSIDGAGTCAGADCGSNVAGSYTVTGTDGSASGTASLTVTAAGLDHLVLSPASATIAAGASQAYTAEGFDSHANSLGDVTGSTTFSIDGAGTCAGADCGSNVAGSYTVTGTDGSASGTASLTVTAAGLDHLVLSPASATIAAGASQAYTAEGFDSHANSLGDVTGSTTFSIDGAGTCAGADCGSNVAGSYTVTGTDGSASGTASLTVTAAGLDHLVLSPASATIAAGASQAYTAEGFDSHANSLGDVTGSTTFSIDGAGTCAGADCGSNVAGSYTVTGTDGSASGTASLTVTAAGLDHLVLSPASATIAAGASQAYTAEGFDSHANSLGDVTGSTTFSIDGAGTCAGADCGSNVAGSYTVTGTDGSASGTASLTVTAAGLDHLVLSPASATIAAGASQAYTAEGFDSHANSLGDVTGSTTFSIDGAGTCAGADCGSNVAGSYTVTGTDGSASGTASLTVTAANQLPTATDDGYSTPEDTLLSVAAPGVLANDTNPNTDPLTGVLQSGPSHGTLSLKSDGSFDYTPAAGYYGSDTFTYVANDGANDSNVATVTIEVVQDLTPPAAPTGLRAVLDTIAVHLTWTASSERDLAGYDVYRGNSTSGPFIKLNATLLTAPAYDDPTAPLGSESFYRVTAVDIHTNESSPAATSATRLIAFRSSSSASNKRTASLAIPRPQGIQAGDALVAAITISGTPTVTAPKGWTLVRNNSSGSTMRQVAYVRIADGSESASFAWTFSSSSGAAGEISAYVGVDSTTPVDGSSGHSGARSTSIRAPSVTTTSDGDLLVALFGSATNATITPPAVMINQASANANAGKSKAASELADQIFGAAGDTGDRTASASAAAVNIGQLVALRPTTNTQPPADTEPPSKPGTPDATVVSSNQVDLTWTPSTDNVRVDHYTIYRTDVTAGGDPLKVGTSTVAQFSDRSATAKATYTYVVVATDPTGNDSPASDPSNGVTTPAAPPPTIAFTGASYASNRGSSLLVARPSGASPGDLLIAAITATDGPTIGAPTGWTRLSLDADGGSLTQAVYWHVLTSSDPAGFAWSFSASLTSIGAMQAYSGVDPTSPVDGTAAAHGSGTTLVSPSISATSSNEMLVAFFALATNGSISVPSGMTQRGVLSGSGPLKLTAEGCDQLILGPGPTGSRTATSGKSANWIASSLMLRVAAQ